MTGEEWDRLLELADQKRWTLKELGELEMLRKKFFEAFRRQVCFYHQDR